MLPLCYTVPPSKLLVKLLGDTLPVMTPVKIRELVLVRTPVPLDTECSKSVLLKLTLLSRAVVVAQVVEHWTRSFSGRFLVEVQHWFSAYQQQQK